VSAEEELEEGGEKEEEAGGRGLAFFVSGEGVSGDIHEDDGKDEARLVKVADCPRARAAAVDAIGSVTKEVLVGQVLAVAGSTAGVPCYGDEGSDEGDVKKDSQEGEDGDAPEEKGQENGEEGIEGCCTGDTLNGSHPYRDGTSISRLSGEEIGEDTEDGGCGEELQEAHGGGRCPDEDATDSHFRLGYKKMSIDGEGGGVKMRVRFERIEKKMKLVTLEKSIIRR